jgi:hypothetical protein
MQAGEGQERNHLHHLVCGGGKRVQAKESHKGSSSASSVWRWAAGAGRRGSGKVSSSPSSVWRGKAGAGKRES